eukprot:g23173.t1
MSAYGFKSSLVEYFLTCKSRQYFQKAEIKLRTVDASFNYRMTVDCSEVLFAGLFVSQASPAKLNALDPDCLWKYDAKVKDWIEEQASSAKRKR